MVVLGGLGIAALIGGSALIAGLGTALFGGLAGGAGQEQAQSQAQTTAADQTIKAPVSQKQAQDTASRAYDYSKYYVNVDAPTHTSVSGSPYASVSAAPSIATPQEKVTSQSTAPSQYATQTPSQLFQPSTTQTPKFEAEQKASATSTKPDAIGSLVLLAAVGVGGYYVYKKGSKK